MELALAGLEEKLGYTFKNQDLLRKALTFNTHTHKRCEFLGDSLIYFLVSEISSSNHPNLHTRDVAIICRKLVRNSVLAEVAISMELEKYISNYGHATRSKILGSGVEALLYALFSDGGLEIARKFVSTQIAPKFDTLEQPTYVDRQGALEKFEQTYGVAPNFKYVRGPEGQYAVEVYARKNQISTGTGASKKSARLNALQIALAKKSSSAQP